MRSKRLLPLLLALCMLALVGCTDTSPDRDEWLAETIAVELPGDNASSACTWQCDQMNNGVVALELSPAEGKTDLTLTSLKPGNVELELRYVRGGMPFITKVFDVHVLENGVTYFTEKFYEEHGGVRIYFALEGKEGYTWNCSIGDETVLIHREQGKTVGQSGRLEGEISCEQEYFEMCGTTVPGATIVTFTQTKDGEDVPEQTIYYHIATGSGGSILMVDQTDSAIID